MYSAVKFLAGARVGLFDCRWQCRRDRRACDSTGVVEFLKKLRFLSLLTPVLRSLYSAFCIVITHRLAVLA